MSFCCLGLFKSNSTKDGKRIGGGGGGGGRHVGSFSYDSNAAHRRGGGGRHVGSFSYDSNAAPVYVSERTLCFYV